MSDSVEGPRQEPSTEHLLHEPPSPAAAPPPAYGWSGAPGPSGTVPMHQQPYPSPAEPRPPYQPAYAGSYPLTPSERNWGMAAHLSSFVAAYVALGFIGPLIVMLTEGNRSAFVRRHAVEALNFNLSVLLWAAISALLVLVLVGLVLLPAVGVLYVVTTVLGTIAASRGQEYRYPLCIRFVH